MSFTPKFHIVTAFNGRGLFKKRKLRLFCFSMDKEKLRTFFFHFGLVVVCVCYVMAGSVALYWIEKPYELLQKNRTHEAVVHASKVFLEDSFDIISKSELHEFSEFNRSLFPVFNRFSQSMFSLYKDSISANFFDSMVYGDCCEMGSWTPHSALLLATTTVIPVGFGLITPLTPAGRIFLIFYAIVGMPLTLMVTSDIGKFVCGFIFSLLDESPMRSMLALMAILISYPFLMGLVISQVSTLSLVDSLYYSMMCIFTIGYGDILPPVSAPALICLIVVGVTLVTVSIELVGSTIIHNVHYMGRQMNRAREIAGRVLKMAQKINVNRGLSLGISQLNAFTRLGMAMDMRHSIADQNSSVERKDTAFEPPIALDFVDFASSSGIFMGDSGGGFEPM